MEGSKFLVTPNVKKKPTGLKFRDFLKHIAIFHPCSSHHLMDPPHCFHRKSCCLFVTDLKFRFSSNLGTCMLILTSTEVDTSGASYYGEQSLHFINVKGDASLIPFGKSTFGLMSFSLRSFVITRHCFVSRSRGS